MGVDGPGKVARVLLLDYRKAFDLVDHTILLSKLANSGLPNFMIKWVTSFLNQRKQRVKISNVTSSWSTINAGVPQGTLLGPTTFLLQINDLQTEANTCKYVDDTTIWEVCDVDGSNSCLQRAAEQAEVWSTKNGMQLNCAKTTEMLINFGRKGCAIPPITLTGETIERVGSCKLLGLIISSDLTWSDHVNKMCKKSGQRIYLLCLLRRAGVPPTDIIKVFKSLIRPILEYGSEVWHHALTKEQTRIIEQIQKRAVKIAYPELPYNEALHLCGLEKLEDRRAAQCKKLFSKILMPDHKLHYLLPEKRSVKYDLRVSNIYPRPTVRTKRSMRSLIVYGLTNYQNSSQF
jgi:hypothetical protein